jgi:peptidoglycan/LPS O-acetylase OafA/YrhL
MVTDNALLHPGPWLLLSGKYGYLGVEIFFVISGFVIPWSLWKGSYDIRDYGRFVGKRLIRLDPPYIASCLMILLIAYASPLIPGFLGTRMTYSWPQLLLHLGYANVLFGYAWINPVLWTLAIEFQYYLGMGLIFPLVFGKSKLRTVLTLGILGILAIVLSDPNFLPHWWFLFLFGVTVFSFRVRVIAVRGFVLGMIAATAGAFLTLGPLICGVGLVTALLIASVNINLRVFKFLGVISYSLYLVHVPIGERALSLSLHFVSVDTLGGKIIAIAVGMAASVFSACLLQWLVEGPSQRLASRVKFKRRALQAA